jgi:hypothetical protein
MMIGYPGNGGFWAPAGFLLCRRAVFKYSLRSPGQRTGAGICFLALLAASKVCRAAPSLFTSLGFQGVLLCGL